ncbi:hypothetical protein KY345_06840 [Candidatus Woesearchaeota archaeon]|nr:hypothetical protein [Candidatus Woesearchaeota archaeon]
MGLNIKLPEGIVVSEEGYGKGIYFVHTKTKTNGNNIVPINSLDDLRQHADPGLLDGRENAEFRINGNNVRYERKAYPGGFFCYNLCCESFFASTLFEKYPRGTVIEIPQNH